MTKQIIGIQGGRGSFNEEAALTHLSAEKLGPFELRYLYTTPQVLTALDRGEINFGQFAIYNNRGGLYDESLSAIVEHTCRIVDRYSIRIRHALMVREDADPRTITTVLTHAQVLKQCHENLARKYPTLKLEVSEGELTDPARIAEAMANGRLATDVATVSNHRLAECFGLKLIENDLQDDINNESTFLLVSK